MTSNIIMIFQVLAQLQMVTVIEVRRHQEYKVKDRLQVRIMVHQVQDRQPIQKGYKGYVHTSIDC